MSEDKNQDSPSADDVVDELADEMGIDESSDDESADDESTDESSNDEAESADTDDEAESDDADDESADTDDEAESDDADDESARADDKSEDDSTDVSEDDEEQQVDDDDDASTNGESKSAPIGPAGTDGSLGPVAGVEELIDPDDTSHVELDSSVDVSEFSALDDLEDDFLDKKTVGIVAGVCLVAAVGLHFVTLDERGSVYHDMALLFQGQYQEEMQRRVSQTEDEYVAAQEEVIPEFGNLFITGSPREALIHLNDQAQYGETPSGGQWRELRVGPDTVIRDLPIDEDHEVTITHPGHEPYEITITEDMWEPAGADYAYDLSVNLTPESIDAHREFQARMDTGGEDEDFVRGEDERFYGTVSFNTNPEGAYLKINSLIARDEDGEIIKTPVVLDEYWTYDINVAELHEEGILEEVARDQQALEQTMEQIETDIEAAEEALEEAREDDELDPDDVEEVDLLEELEEIDPRELDVDERKVAELNEDLVELEQREFPVDRPPNRGDSVQIIFPDDHGDTDELYEYATMLQRAMWECEWKDDDERDRLDDDAPRQEHCNYVYQFNKDFHDIADYIEWRKEEQQRVEEERYMATEQLEALDEEFDEKLRALGHTIDDVERIEHEDAEDANGQQAEEITQ